MGVRFVIYSEVVDSGLILPRKNKYTMRDAWRVVQQSLFSPYNGRTLTLQQAAFVCKCSAVCHDTDYSKRVGSVAVLKSASLSDIFQ